MLFRIAGLLGRTVSELERTMTAREFDEWCALYSLEPWGNPIDNWRAAMIACTVANFTDKPKKPFSIDQFLPKKRKRAQTADQMLRFFRAVFGGGKK